MARVLLGRSGDALVEMIRDGPTSVSASDQGSQSRRPGVQRLFSKSASFLVVCVLVKLGSWASRNPGTDQDWVASDN